MATIPRSEFVRLVRGLSAASIAEFVADIWRARDRRVQWNQEAVIAADPDTGETVRLWVTPTQDGVDVGSRAGEPSNSNRTVDVDRDLLVTVRTPAHPGSASDLTVDADIDATIDVDDLYHLLQFALSRADADRLARTYFDRPFHRVPSPPSDTSELAGTDESTTALPITLGGGAVPPFRGSRGLVFAGVTLLLIAGVIGVTAFQIDPGEAAGDLGTPEPTVAGLTEGPQDSVTPTEIPDDSVETESPRRDRPPVDLNRTPRSQAEASGRGSLPAGVSSRGIVDAGRLADSHEAALEGRSYILEITHRELVDGRPEGVAREQVVVASPTTYRSTIQRVGSLRNDPMILADRSTYADGDNRYVRLDRENRTAYLRESPTLWRGGLRGQDRFVERTSAYVRWYLSVDQSWVAGVTERDSMKYYWVVTDGEPFPGYPNAKGSAVIDENGLVHELHRTYSDPDDVGREIHVSIRFTHLGNVTVTPPSWADEARSEVGPATTDTAPPVTTAGPGTETVPTNRTGTTSTATPTTTATTATESPTATGGDTPTADDSERPS